MLNVEGLPAPLTGELAADAVADAVAGEGADAHTGEGADAHTDEAADVPGSETLSEGESADAVAERESGAQAGLQELLGELVVELREQSAIGRDRERVIDRLHAENQSLRQGELQAAMAPLLKDLIALHDDLHQTASRYDLPDPDLSRSASRDFRSFCQALQDVLARFGVERFEVEPGSPYNAREHRAVRSVPTADITQDRCISEVIRCGFRNEIRVVRPLEAVVMTFRHSPPENQAPTH